MELSSQLDSKTSVRTFVESGEFSAFLRDIECFAAKDFLEKGQKVAAVESLHSEAKAQRDQNVISSNRLDIVQGCARYILIVQSIALIEISAGRRDKVYEALDNIRSAWKFVCEKTGKKDPYGIWGTLWDLFTKKATKIVGGHKTGCPLCFVVQCRRLYETGKVEEHAC